MMRSGAHNFFDGESDIFRNLTEQRGSNVAALVHRDGGASAIGMPVLDVRTALPHVAKSKCLQPTTDF